VGEGEKRRRRKEGRWGTTKILRERRTKGRGNAGQVVTEAGWRSRERGRGGVGRELWLSLGGEAEGAGRVR